MSRIPFSCCSLLVLFGIAVGCSGASRTESSPPVMTAIEAVERAKKSSEATAQAAAARTAAATPSLPEDTAPEDLLSAPSTGTFKVRFETTAGDFVVEVHREWSPIGAQRFYELVQSGFYDECRFFRVVPGFMVQFGINGDPAEQSKWRQNLRDDPVRKSNTRGYMTFAMAGPNTRTTQVFINYGDNSTLDSQGFSPFGVVVEGMQNVDAIYSGYGERPDQGAIQSTGNSYLKGSFPELDYIRKATIPDAQE